MSTVREQAQQGCKGSTVNSHEHLLAGGAGLASGSWPPGWASE